MTRYRLVEEEYQTFLSGFSPEPFTADSSRCAEIDGEVWCASFHQGVHNGELCTSPYTQCEGQVNNNTYAYWYIDEYLYDLPIEQSDDSTPITFYAYSYNGAYQSNCVGQGFLTSYDFEGEFESQQIICRNVDEEQNYSFSTYRFYTDSEGAAKQEWSYLSEDYLTQWTSTETDEYTYQAFVSFADYKLESFYDEYAAADGTTYRSDGENFYIYDSETDTYNQTEVDEQEAEDFRFEHIPGYIIDNIFDFLDYDEEGEEYEEEDTTEEEEDTTEEEEDTTTEEEETTEEETA